jgi:hypothetical protein
VKDDEQYQVKTSNMFVALENLDDVDDMLTWYPVFVEPCV